MDIRTIHSKIKQLVPESGVVQVQHTYINNICGEHYTSAVYGGEDIDYMMFYAHMQPTPEGLIAEVARLYAEYNPEEKKAEEIAKLKRQLANLTGELTNNNG